MPLPYNTLAVKLSTTHTVEHTTNLANRNTSALMEGRPLIRPAKDNNEAPVCQMQWRNFPSEAETRKTDMDEAYKQRDYSFPLW